jgi:hypothetical protein
MNRKKIRKILIVCIILGFAIEAGLIWKIYEMPFRRIKVVESSNIKDFYWKINQVKIDCQLEPGKLHARVKLQNNMPNFAYYKYQIGEGTWQIAPEDTLFWPLKPGDNLLKVKGVNQLGGETRVFTCLIQKNSSPTPSIIINDGDIETPLVPFIFEDARTQKMQWLRQKALNITRGASDQLTRYETLIKYVYHTIPDGPPIHDSAWNPVDILKQAQKGMPYLCDEFAVSFIGLANSIGLTGRLWHLNRRENGHYTTEVWLNKWNKWAVMDPYLATYYLKDGIPLSALEIHQLVKEKRLDQVQIQYLGKESKPKENIREGLKRYQYIQLVLGNAFLKGYQMKLLGDRRVTFLNWVDESTPPLGWAAREEVLWLGLVGFPGLLVIMAGSWLLIFYGKKS